ncbi:hypothetical protein [Candidatus Protochlamydia phocaeensis]|uniref:hypothetical protein n=1 Tax=Candidatus Protochlamydia phocaeensis TaxID=1414722 RepID=UPI000839168A|nr:hypothetical protein [Candidatus Protochlamydia phocaeensis]
MSLVTERTPFVLYSDSDSVPSQTSTGSIFWAGIKSFCGRRIKPLLPRIAQGVVATTALVASGTFLMYKNQLPDSESSMEDKVAETVCWINLGVSLRALIESFSVTPAINQYMQQAHTFTTNLSFWGFLMLWNTAINVPDSAQEKVLGMISAWAGYNVTNDFIQIVNQIKQDGSHLLNSRGQEDQEVISSIEEPQQEDQGSFPSSAHVQDTPLPERISVESRNAPICALLEPAHTQVKVNLLINAAKITCGVSATLFVNLYLSPSNQLFPLYNACGYLLIGAGAGEIGMEGLLQVLKKIESNLQKRELESRPMRARRIALTVMKTSIQAIPKAVIEMNALLSIFHNNQLAILLGIMYGITKRDAKQRFQNLTKEIYTHKKEINKVPLQGCWKGLKKSKILKALSITKKDKRIRTAILVDRAVTIPLFMSLTGFSIAVVCTDQSQDQIAILAFLASTLGFAGFSTWLKNNFRPGRNNRLFNEIYFNIFENRECLPLLYSLLTQISKINDISLFHDTPLQLMFGVAAISTFGAMLGQDRVESGSIDRNPIAYTDPGFRMASLETILLMLKQ